MSGQILSAGNVHGHDNNQKDVPLAIGLLPDYERLQHKYDLATPAP
ncbi:hypothetical protein [Klebsiella phage vB_Kpn_IME260]|uniref:Uncharacterized protein n=1 Tax=Klebsiella phage vB_Kpn_IME260 TaxID=1912318 RepID=A0A1L6Z507_9CAUD|nr:hypothetical protein FDH16_gp045 [Klebsiella phage vB_Kpn_IME260]APT41091.1 hypothetical protein [Klebsiella phage vB_Kpn_IME260]